MISTTRSRVIEVPDLGVQYEDVWSNGMNITDSVIRACNKLPANQILQKVMMGSGEENIPIVIRFNSFCHYVQDRIGVDDSRLIGNYSDHRDVGYLGYMVTTENLPPLIAQQIRFRKVDADKSVVEVPNLENHDFLSKSGIDISDTINKLMTSEFQQDIRVRVIQTLPWEYTFLVTIDDNNRGAKDIGIVYHNQNGRGELAHLAVARYLDRRTSPIQLIDYRLVDKPQGIKVIGEFAQKPLQNPIEMPIGIWTYEDLIRGATKDTSIQNALHDRIRSLFKNPELSVKFGSSIHNAYFKLLRDREKSLETLKINRETSQYLLS